MFKNTIDCLFFPQISLSPQNKYMLTPNAPLEETESQSAKTGCPQTKPKGRNVRDQPPHPPPPRRHLTP